MAKAKKLPSGNWRTRIFDYADAQGKKHYKSFTAKTKKESEYLATQYDIRKKENELRGMTVADCIEQYIKIKSNTLSPSTIRGYITLQQNNYNSIGNISIDELSSANIQEWIGTMVSNYSAKTIRNAYGLLVSAINMFGYEKKINVKLPQAVVNNNYIPTDTEIAKLINFLRSNNTELYKAVCLASFGTLRRGEICALTSDDINGTTVTINKAMVKTKDNTWKIKTPKNISSNRNVDMPKFVIDALPKKGKIVNANPDYITCNFARIIKRLGMPHFRFHDLRHYSASIMHAIGVPDVYIMERGGWKSDITLKNIYRNSLSDYQRIYTDKTNGYFDKFTKI